MPIKQVKEGNLKSDEVRKIARKQPERPQRTPAALALDKATALATQLDKLDLETVEKGEKAQLIMELEHLKRTIEKIIG